MIVALTGCTSPSQSQHQQQSAMNLSIPEVPNNTAGPLPPEVFNFSGNVTGVGVSAGYVGVGDHVFNFTVKPNAWLLVAKLEWNGTDDLDLYVNAPDCNTMTGQGVCLKNDNGTYFDSDSPVLISYDGPGLSFTGQWDYKVWGKDAVNVPFHGNVAVYYD